MSERGAIERLLFSPGRQGAVWLHRPSGVSRVFHRHAELEWNIVTAGRASYLVADQRFDLTCGSEIWLFPKQEHLLIEESSDYEMWIVVLRPELLAWICAAGGDAALLSRLPPEGACTRVLPESVMRELVWLCEDLGTGATNHAVFHAGLSFLVQRAWQEHQKSEGLPASTDLHPAVERAVRLLRDGDDLRSIAEIAEACRLSESQLSRLFRQQVGVTMVHFRQARRLERFLALYGKGRRRNLTEAALEAGFGSYSHFHRAFREAYGFGPRAYHKRLEESG